MRHAEVPRLHHGEVGESAAHSVMREAVCASEDVNEDVNGTSRKQNKEQCISPVFLMQQWFFWICLKCQLNSLGVMRPN